MSVLMLAMLAFASQDDRAPAPPPRPRLVHGYLYFASGSPVPLPQTDIDPIAWLSVRVPPEAFVYVRGQTDTVGSASANEALSRDRARAVADRLVEGGIDPERITIMACGERLLNRATADEVAEPLNRFVLFDWSEGPPRSGMGCPTEPYRP